MAKPLTYLSLKCVLEYLEANKRIHMTTRCSAIHKMERRIPLHLDQLSLGYSEIILNDITFELFSFENNIRLILKKNLRRYLAKTQVPDYLEFQEVMNHITECLLGSRPQIIVKNLKIIEEKKEEIPRLPFDLKLYFRELDCHYDHIDYLIPIITDLKKLILHECSWDDTCFDLPIVQNVSQLTINGFSEPNVWGNTLIKLSNREVVLNVESFSINSLINFIQLLLDAGKEIGTYYRIEFQSRVLTVSSIKKNLKERFKAKVNEETKNNKHRTDPFYFSINIPKNTEWELSVCGSNCDDKKRIEIKIVPTPPKLSWNNVKCVLEYMEENRRFCLTTLCPNLCGIESTGILHLNYLSLGCSLITLNDFTYKFYKLKGKQFLPYDLHEDEGKDLSADSVIRPDDILMALDSRESHVKINDQREYPVYIGLESLASTRKVPSFHEFYVAMRLLTGSSFGGKPDIRVKQLEIRETIRIPSGLKLQVQELIARQNVVEFASKIIDDRSLPLKKLKMIEASWNHPVFKLRIVQNAKRLKILEHGLHVHEEKLLTSWEKTLLHLPNQRINLKCELLKTTSLINYIQNLMDTGRDIGTIHTIDCSLTSSCEEMLHFIGRQYNRVAKIMKMNTNESDIPIIKFSIALSMSSTSDLIISGDANHVHCTIKTEVVPSKDQIIRKNSAYHIPTNFFPTFFSNILSCVRQQNRK